MRIREYAIWPIANAATVRDEPRFASVENKSNVSAWVFAKGGRKIELKPGESCIVEIEPLT